MDQSNLTKYRQALLGASGVTAPGDSPNATPAVQPQIANLQRMYSGQFQAGAAQKAIGAVGGASNAQANQEDAAAKMALQEEQDKADALAQQKKDLLDPTKYRQEISADGGYDFFDPQGNPIDVKQYSGATGKHITDVLKKSQNPSDQEFVNQYKNVEQLGQIFQSGSKDELNKYLKKNPDVQADYDLLKKHLGKTPTYGDIVATFRQSQPKFFNSQQPIQQQPTTYGGKTFNDITGGGGNSILDRVKGFLGGE